MPELVLPLYLVLEGSIPKRLCRAKLESLGSVIIEVVYTPFDYDAVAVFSEIDRTGAEPIFKVQYAPDGTPVRVDITGIKKKEGDSPVDEQKSFTHLSLPYQEQAKFHVRQYLKHVTDRSDKPVKLGPDDVYVVWFCKTLGNWKALVSTNLPDQMYYEVTYDGVKKQTYLDVYKKWANVMIPDDPEASIEVWGGRPTDTIF